MKRKLPFVNKFMERLNKVDTDSIRTYVHDLAQSFEIFLDIFDELDEAVVLLDRDQKITYFNQAAKNILGLTTRKTAERYDLAIIPDTHLREALHLALEDVSTLPFPDIINLLEPRETILSAKLIAFRSRDQELFLCLLKDTSASHGPAEWEQKISRIESMVKLAAGVAHEIGNPLNSIGIHLQMLKNDIQKSAAKNESELLNAVDVIQTETKRLDQIVRHFLSATRKPPIRFKLENLNQIIAGALEVMKPELTSNRIELTFTQDSELPEFMLDRDRIQVALVNLIKNASEAMPNGGELTVSVSHKSKVACVEVADTGVGIENSALPKIFDAYFTTKKEGHGLGLMTVFDSTHDHGGKVDVSSRVGHGTTIKLLIPIREPKLQLSQSDERKP